MPKQAPAIAATPDDTLPETAVSKKLAQLQNKLEVAQDAVVPPADIPSSDEEATFKKRYSDLRRFQQQKETEAAKEVAALKSQINQLSAAQNAPLPKTREEFEAWKAKYPDIVGFIEIIAEERASAAKQELEGELGTVKDKLAMTEREKAFANLLVLVPDLEELVKSNSYIDWLANQPHFIQETLNNSEDPHQIAYYINVYKSTLRPVVNKPADKLAPLATSVKNSGTTPSANSGKYDYTQSQIFKMKPHEYEAQETDIIKARNSGRILDDMSKRNSVFD